MKMFPPAFIHYYPISFSFLNPYIPWTYIRSHFPPTHIYSPLSLLPHPISSLPDFHPTMNYPSLPYLPAGVTTLPPLGVLPTVVLAK